MANFQLRDVDDQTWSSIMVRAQLEGWPLQRLIVTLLEDYQAGRIVPSKPAPLAPAKPQTSALLPPRQVVVLKFTCPHCNKALEAECEYTQGFSYMSPYPVPVPCPHCGEMTERSLPSTLIDTFKPGARAAGPGAAGQ